MSRSVIRALSCCIAFGVIACAPEAPAQSGQGRRDTPAQPGPPPLVFIESEPNGARYVRVMEATQLAFRPVQSMMNLQSSERINVRDAAATLVRDVVIRNARYGVHVRNASPALIENFSFLDWNGGDGIHGAAIKIDRSGPAPTYIQRVFADGMEEPDASYQRSNTDFIGIERSAGPVFVRYATGRNFGDGGVDAKSDTALMNVTVDGAHRGLRVWDGVTLTIVNSIVNVPDGHEQVWLQDATSRLRYNNVLWCVGSRAPSQEARECSNEPTAIGGEGRTQEQIVALSSNPLPEMDAFFATHVDRIVVEYSSDGGSNWREMANSGSRGHAPRGDTRFRVPFNLDGATYLFRVQFEYDGARSGRAVTIDEEGRSVGA